MYKMSDQKFKKASNAWIKLDDANHIDQSEQKIKKGDTSIYFASCDKKLRKVLPDGFGFTDDTYKFRLPEYQPIRNLDGRPFEETMDKIDLEQDLIVVEGVVKRTLSRSNCAPDMFSNEHRHGKLIAKKRICIPHICSDKLEYDEFGAKLYTYEVKERDGTIYYHHILRKVKFNGPAKIMGIEDNDELVLLIGRFIPDLKQEDVLKLFHKVKVDGKTRFVLVIRRKRDRWIWLELSAILAPETGTEVFPIVEQPKRELLKDNCHQYSETAEVYKVPGTQLYLQISNGIVSIDMMNELRDKSKIIWKRVYVCQADDAGEFKFEASICDETKKLYITIDNNKNIVLNSEPQLFDIFGAEADKVRFGANGMYLGYNRDTKQVRAQLHTCVFEEFPVQYHSGLDQPDGRLTHCKEEDQSDDIVPHISIASTSQRSTNPGESSVLSSEMGCETERSIFQSDKYRLSPQIITDSKDSDIFLSAK